MRYIDKLLNSFDYHTWYEFATSLVPSYKYKLSMVTVLVSVSLPPIERVFGLDGLAVAGLIIVFITELTSGAIASKIKKEPLSSVKLGRFTFKAFFYIVLICVPYLMAESFRAKGKELATVMFDWLHLFMLAQVIIENMISILENVAVISGKDKTHWIKKIQDKINGLLS
ncbi:phage holin family protein [Sphingobacterium cavernae]|uniref:phage holin family protein n=1 Tax=Sphingobacterium cavernae TaxID=2592657 RepID=UPI00122FF550|nr:phage holin family protein [Sphingobacterium cavernae]